MEYELRVVVEKVLVSTREVVKRDTLKTYDVKPPESILIGKYLSGLRKFDHVVIVKAGFESQLRAARVPITFGMRALGMTSQIRDGRLYRGIEPRHVPELQGLDNPA